jgi:RNA polymerase sigma factor (sigma-70 family)
VTPEAAAAVQAAFARLAGGERGAFDEIYGALWPLMRALCHRELAHAADAEDAAQRALIRLFERAADFDPGRSAVGWALTLAAWECRTTRRQRARGRLDPLSAAHEPPDEAQDPCAQVAAGEARAHLAAALERLAPLDRQTLLDTLREDAPAAVAGATFRKRRQRAMARLRAALGLGSGGE